MYAALWRILPGAWWWKVGALIALASGVLVFLGLVAFPLVAEVFLVEDSVIGSP
jgi:hypothetical protein